MSMTETVELTVLCLIYNNDAYLLQNRVKEDWKGYTFPGGHIEIIIDDGQWKIVLK